jgi:hypothetical protein
LETPAPASALAAPGLTSTELAVEPPAERSTVLEPTVVVEPAAVGAALLLEFELEPVPKPVAAPTLIAPVAVPLAPGVPEAPAVAVSPPTAAEPGKAWLGATAKKEAAATATPAIPTEINLDIVQIHLVLHENITTLITSQSFSAFPETLKDNFRKTQRASRRNVM